jgi:hypothetical protein
MIRNFLNRESKNGLIYKIKEKFKREMLLVHEYEK